VVAMAIFAHDPFHHGFTGFSLSYAAFQLILTYLWWRTGVHDPDHRPLSRPYSSSCLISAMLFAVSVFAPAELRLWLWGAGIAVALTLPVLMMMLRQTRAEVQEQIELSTRITPSLSERMGLFTIIVLGEVIAGVIAGMTGHHALSWSLFGVAALGTLIAIGLWWVYFDAAAGMAPKGRRMGFIGWAFLHLLLTMGIAGTGASVGHAIGHAGEHVSTGARWILVSMVAFTLLTIGGLVRIVKHSGDVRRIHYIAGKVMLVGAIPAVLLGFLEIEVLPLLGILAALVLAPILLAILTWVLAHEE